MKYRKKPVVVEAFKYDGDLLDSSGHFYVPDWAVRAYEHRELFFKGQAQLFIHTLEGDMEAQVGDYIIKGIKGEIYPCKPDIFEKSYEPAEE